MELNSLFEKFKGKSGKLLTFILIGILLLIVVMPVKNNNNFKASNSTYKPTDSADTDDALSRDVGTYESYAAYYEEKLTDILEKSYGKGTMSVMVSLKRESDKTDLYDGGADKDFGCVDGVLIVADVKDAACAADISFAVCALFNLPAHKVAVLIKN